MTQRRDLDARLKVLGEVGQIMSSLKTLALIEDHKLGRYATALRSATEVVSSASRDFAQHYPVVDWQPACSLDAYIVLGSERGFCGNYNDALIPRLQELLRSDDKPHRVIAVGQKLASYLPPDIGEPIALQGAGIAEDMETSLLRIAAAIMQLQRNAGVVALTVIYHDPVSSEVVDRKLFPVMLSTGDAPGAAYPPRLNLDPQAMFMALLDECLYSQLHTAYYDALTAENRQRIAHLEAAIDHLDRQRNEFRLRMNSLRQEEITEEIEVILLSAGAFSAQPS